MDGRSHTPVPKLEHLHYGAIKDTPTLASKDLPILSSTIQYLHKSVAEFLHTNEVWEEITAMTAKTSFEANACLAHAALYLLKIQSPNTRSKQSVWRFLGHFASFFRTCESFSDTEILELIDTLDSVMKHFHDGYQIGSGSHWSSQMPLTIGDDLDPTTKHELNTGHNILTFAIRMAFHRYIKVKTLTDKSMQSSTTIPLYALDSWFNKDWRPPFGSRMITLKELPQTFPQTTTLASMRHWEHGLYLACKQVHYRDKGPLNFPLDRGELVKFILVNDNIQISPFTTVSWSDLHRLVQRLKHFPLEYSNRTRHDFAEEDYRKSLIDYDADDIDPNEIRDLGADLEKLCPERIPYLLNFTIHEDCISSTTPLNSPGRQNVPSTAFSQLPYRQYVLPNGSSGSYTVSPHPSPVPSSSSLLPQRTTFNPLNNFSSLDHCFSYLNMSPEPLQEQTWQLPQPWTTPQQSALRPQHNRSHPQKTYLQPPLHLWSAAERQQTYHETSFQPWTNHPTPQQSYQQSSNNTIPLHPSPILSPQSRSKGLTPHGSPWANTHEAYQQPLPAPPQQPWQTLCPNTSQEYAYHHTRPNYQGNPNIRASKTDCL